MSPTRAELVRGLAAKVLPDAKAQEAHVQATYERMLEATGKAMLGLDLLTQADPEQMHDVAIEAFAAMAHARSALIDHAQAVLTLARSWSGE